MHRTTAIILGINLGLLLLLAAISMASNADHGMAGFVLFWMLIPLWLLNGVAWVVTLFKLPDSRPFFMGFLLACIILPIIGLGACGLSFMNG